MAITVKLALANISGYPIPDEVIEKTTIDRELVLTDNYTMTIRQSKNFELATADLYMWLYTSPDFKEQEISFTQSERANFLLLANKLYLQHGDANLVGGTYGFIGENYND